MKWKMNLIINSTILYGAKKWQWQKNRKDRILQRKILRTILGPVETAHSEYRTRMNDDLRQEIEEDIEKINQKRASTGREVEQNQ